MTSACERVLQAALLCSRMHLLMLDVCRLTGFTPACTRGRVRGLLRPVKFASALRDLPGSASLPIKSSIQSLVY